MIIFEHCTEPLPRSPCEEKLRSKRDKRERRERERDREKEIKIDETKRAAFFLGALPRGPPGSWPGHGPGCEGYECRVCECREKEPKGQEKPKGARHTSEHAHTAHSQPPTSAQSPRFA